MPAPRRRPATSRTAALVVLSRRRPHEGKVDLDGLFEELGLVGAVDGGAGFGERVVLYQGVALSVKRLSAMVGDAQWRFFVCTKTGVESLGLGQTRER
jgi:hypothetical protein